MDFTKQGLTYIFLFIPVLFAATVLLQGIHKLKNNDSDGRIAVAFAVIFLILIIAAYLFFLR